MPSDDRPRVVDHERHIDEPGPRPHIGEVRDPTLVGRRRGEIPFQQIRRASGVAVRDGGPQSLASHEAVDPQLTHQPVDLPIPDSEALPAQQRRHLPPPIYRLRGRFAFRVHPGSPDRVDDDRVREVTVAGLGAFPCPISPLGDRHTLLSQNFADRPDRAVLGALFLNEGEDQRRRGSSSPAKKTAASRRIAFASRSSQFSHSSLRIRSDSLEVTPSR